MAKAKPEPSGPLDRSPSHLLHRALQRALDLYAASAGADAPSQRQYAVLAAVAAEEGITQTGLVKATGIDRSTLAELVSRMMTKGLLARERSAVDARANAVSLTDAGREALEKSRPLAAAADAAILKLLPSGKRAAFLTALARLSAGEGKPKSKDKEKAGKADRKRRKKEAKKAGRKADAPVGEKPAKAPKVSKTAKPPATAD